MSSNSISTLNTALRMELALLGVKARGFTLIPSHARVFPAAITIVALAPVDEKVIAAALFDIEVDYWRLKQYRKQAIEGYIKHQLLSRLYPAGVAVCDHRDLFDPDTGEMIAIDRFLTVMRAKVIG